MEMSKAMKHVLNANTVDSHLNLDEVVAFDGKIIDVSGSIWRVGPDQVINWHQMPTSLGGQVIAALNAYFKHMIRTYAPRSIVGRFESIRLFFKTVLELNVDLSRGSGLHPSLLNQVRIALNTKYALATVTGALHAYRIWYIWATDAEIPGFDFDMAADLESFTIGGGVKGEAVLRNDPKNGPLHSTEFDRLYQAMQIATESGPFSVDDLAVMWLFMALGCRPRSLQLLNEEDLIRTEMADGTVKYELRIPRVKKPGEKERSRFRTRPLRREIGRLLEKIVAANRGARALQQDLPYRCSRSTPMFRTAAMRESLIGTAFEEEAFRWRTTYFSDAVARVTEWLGLAGCDGEPLHLTPRRLRYTFATRLVQDGASPVMLADALDHTDLQHVMVYYNARSDIVIDLDETMAAQLTPWGQAFMGTIVRTEARATRGNDPASRIRHLDRRRGKLENIGTCGRFDPCGLMAPIACYTCRKFQAWLEAPHELVLNALREDRDQHLQRGADPKMTQARDLTISAVTWVVKRIGLYTTVRACARP
ncbi:site-specific integrase [Ralstonia solanacearum]|uniref:site-specific integrase n=1 Tax=Ralstonia solanacearum TaxID=305 RepID=UPI0011447503|nr:site-specific integrase [Ralstonia solanacearum]MBT1537103.1 site-specific integrase [Ralstonia solanacearum]